MPPEQIKLGEAVAFIVNAGGCVMLIVLVDIQPPVLDDIIVYPPAQREEQGNVEQAPGVTV